MQTLTKLSLTGMAALDQPKDGREETAKMCQERCRALWAKWLECVFRSHASQHIAAVHLGAAVGHY